jgi:hypothetical protein
MFKDRIHLSFHTSSCHYCGVISIPTLDTSTSYTTHFTLFVYVYLFESYLQYTQITGRFPKKWVYNERQGWIQVFAWGAHDIR